MLFCIFSFNRGQFLRNCVQSIERSAPHARIAVFDDNSYDDFTREVLEDISRRHTVLQPGKTSTHKLGGLYGNMQSALEYARDEQLVCFIQDDMQVVRQISEQEVEDIHGIFAADPELAFIQPCFLKGCNRARDVATLQYDADKKAYFRKDTSQSAGRHFSAVLITKPARLLEKNWVFARSEPENDLQARQLFGKMGHLYAPIAMWLPEVPAYRGKKKTFALRWAEKKRGVGFYPFEMLSEVELDALVLRSPNVLPVAEDFLRCSNDTLPKPWMYYPLQGSKWLKKLNILELAIDRALRRSTVKRNG